MSGIYLTWLADVLRANGLSVVETNGWKTRARSSGGFPSTPLGVQWHHTASQTSPENDIHWQTVGCPDAPVGNMTIMRDGSVWLVAAGAANTAGKGGPLTLSRGTIPLDSANTRTVAIEAANSGVGEPWPQAQIDAYFATSNAINKQLGNLPSDVFTHALGAGDGWTDRKIDPATANAVQGPWRPNSVSGSGTWSLADIRAECNRRAGTIVPPLPPIGDNEMVWVIKGGSSDSYYAWNGVSIAGIPGINWVTAGVTLGLYQNADPIVYSQGEIDELIETQGER